MRKTLRKTVKKKHGMTSQVLWQDQFKKLSTEEWSKYLLFVIQFSKSIMPITL